MKCIENKHSIIANRTKAVKYHWSDEARKNHMNENNPAWKGNEVGYFALHEWITSRKPKTSKCERCKINSPNDLSNISGKYLRDIEDYEWLCRSCHMKSDGRMFKRNEMGEFVSCGEIVWNRTEMKRNEEAKGMQPC